MTRAKQELTCREHCPEAASCPASKVDELIDGCVNGGPTKRLFGLLGVACESDVVNPFVDAPGPRTHEDEAFDLIARSMANGGSPF